jgi:protein-S-isoprenylcysteine O-methyltransferase Ste14
MFLDAKRRREEAWLVQANPEYEEYRRSVRHSFLPYVW